jgi:hypothetical protein
VFSRVQGVEGNGNGVETGADGEVGAEAANGANGHVARPAANKAPVKAVAPAVPTASWANRIGYNPILNSVYPRDSLSANTSLSHQLLVILSVLPPPHPRYSLSAHPSFLPQS